ncbi:hypothetical protein DDI_2015 [Dickeya dianthicola RNS04.9]|nr:hypothetical protein DDI_2015 [Dickeya dianthicola RNS04.9]
MYRLLCVSGRRAELPISFRNHRIAVKIGAITLIKKQFDI